MFKRFQLSPEMRSLRNFALNIGIGVIVINTAADLAIKGIDKVFS